jgi:hypothetical protein
LHIPEVYVEDFKAILFVLTLMVVLFAVSAVVAEFEMWLEKTRWGPSMFARHGMKVGFKFRGWVVWEAPPFPDLSDKRTFAERAKRYVFVARDGPLAGTKLELVKLSEKLPPGDVQTEAITVISVGDEGYCAFPSAAVAEAWGDYFGRPLGEWNFGPKYQGFWQRTNITPL